MTTTTTSAPALTHLPFEVELPAPKTHLRTWRSTRLGLMKKRPEYQGLPKVCQRVVDYLVRRHESPDEGITVSQSNADLLSKFGISRRQTMNEYLGIIVSAGVFTVESRSRELGTKG